MNYVDEGLCLIEPTGSCCIFNSHQLEVTVERQLPGKNNAIKFYYYNIKVQWRGQQLSFQFSAATAWN